MKFTQIPENTFQNLQMNAGILVRSFDPASGEISGLIGATTGGIQFQDTPEYSDFGEDIDNCPKNTKELKHLDSHDVKVSGTFVTINAATAKSLAAAADVDANDSTHIVPRNDLAQTDFDDLWWVGDYSDVNTGANAGYLAIHLMNALNTNGFQIQSTDKAKGTFAFEYTGHYSINAQDTVPYEIYIKGSSSPANPAVFLNTHYISLSSTGEATLSAITTPSGQTVTWTSSNTSVASVANGVVSAEGTGNAIITASITVEGVTATDTCTVVVAGT